jgi:hypothetical protein
MRLATPRQTLTASLLLALVVLACHPRARHPRQTGERLRIACDSRVDDWRVGDETKCPTVVHAVQGCYVVQVKYREEFTRVHGASPLWGVSLLAGAIDTATRVHTARYETGYVPFALPLRNHHNYYVTATFNGDEFMPRIVELNAASERTREILPATSVEELEKCKAHSPLLDEDDAVCQTPSRNAR